MQLVRTVCLQIIYRTGTRRIAYGLKNTWTVFVGNDKIVTTKRESYTTTKWNLILTFVILIILFWFKKNLVPLLHIDFQKNHWSNAVERFFLGRRQSIRFFGLKNFSVELGQKIYPRSRWSNCSSSVGHSRNIDSLGRVGRNILSLCPDDRKIPFLVEPVET